MKMYGVIRDSHPVKETFIYIYIFFQFKAKKMHILAVMKYFEYDNNISTGNTCLPCLGNV